jgi:hypothetical protein
MYLKYHAVRYVLEKRDDSVLDQISDVLHRMLEGGPTEWRSVYGDDKIELKSCTGYFVVGGLRGFLAVASLELNRRTRDQHERPPFLFR